ncbi:hypothetical protein VZT92_022231 [Zoarces viviparus]|uniref:Uncharacterized protein n=1 Tax=Zoarces viviparus TaxID=48416 RepID=A0AAW1EB79_ZOAVI
MQLTVLVSLFAVALSEGRPEEWDLTPDPALLAIICVFSFAFVALLVYTIVKCTRSSGNDFERLEDVLMSNVNEASPFAKQSK